MIDCNAPADASEFVYCAIEAIQPTLDALYLLGGIAVAFTLAVVGMRIAKQLIRSI